jgi:TctA family transporter
LTIVGVSLIASLSGDSLIRGLIAGLFGFLLATIGMDPITSVARYTLDQTYLLGGIPIVPPVIGLFAIPEIIDLAVRGGSIAQSGVTRLDNAFEGVKDTFRHFGLTVRCSLIGAFVGMLPGLGGGVGQWIAYGHAVQGAKDKTRFGKGAVEGVIAPGAANNSTAGGALIPTVVFGVPGSVVMAVLLGAFIITGIAPGPDMLTKYLDVTYSLVWIVILSNLIAVPLCFLLLNHLAKITYVRGTLLIPFLLLLVFIGAFVSTNNIIDLLVVLMFGILGYGMALSNWPRPPLLLGLVLGRLAESNLWIAVQRDGLKWLADPMVLVLLFIGLASFAYPIMRAWSAHHEETKP